MTSSNLVSPALLTHLCDDAAIFPPGLKPLAQAVPDHLEHRRSERADFVGPFLLSAAAVIDVASIVAELPVKSISLSLTVPNEEALAGALDRVDALPAFQLVGVEIPLQESSDPEEAISLIAKTLEDRDLDVFIEIPRDIRRDQALESTKRAGFNAKFRTGGIRSDLYPTEVELAESLQKTIDHGLRFKATAGLHHAIRNTDPQTGFEQHGFLNILAAVAVLLEGGDISEVIDVLAERDGDVIAKRLSSLNQEMARQVRHHFRSFGTCSIHEPVDEMTELGLINR